MEKILISVHTPYIEQQYDFLVPINIVTKDVMDLIQDAISKNDENYVLKEKIFVLDSKNGKVINLNNIVKFSGLKNGSHIMIL